MARDNLILQRAINEGLDQLGGPIVKTIVWHLRSNGVFLDSQSEIDLRLFHKHLEDIVGNIADIVLSEVYESLRKRYPNCHDSMDSHLGIIDRIDRLLAKQAGGDAMC